MCRFALYLGPEITLDALLIEPSNSIIHQSFHSHERVEPAAEGSAVLVASEPLSVRPFAAATAP